MVITRDRVGELCRTLTRLRSLEPAPPVVVVDNASRDSTRETVRSRFPEVTLVENDRNAGCAARDTGVALTETPYVAFSDDDSWWYPGALERAADALDAHPRLGLVAAAVYVGEEERPDPVNGDLLHSPLAPAADLPWPRALGFLACASVVRRAAYDEVGGFGSLLFFGGEEALLAQDLTVRGWGLCHLPQVHAHHRPSASRPPSRWRRTLEQRNALLTVWLRRRPGVVLERTARALARGVRDPEARRALRLAVAMAPRVWAARSRLPASVEEDLACLERT
ncbi:glycosyltransferase [Nocardiopsis sp. NPDC007018]|uniref:glycosyltransferase family 2 protein n=1 Tax=Nocardiopsis sp. NPDC007018 TaxID=3155721 RepID=UPI0033FFDE6F